MPSGFYTANGIPSNGVINSFGDLQVAMWANPSLVVIGVCTNAGLGCVGNASFNFFPANSKSHR